MIAAARVQVPLRVGTGLTLEALALFLQGVEAPGLPSLVPPVLGPPHLLCAQLTPLRVRPPVLTMQDTFSSSRRLSLSMTDSRPSSSCADTPAVPGPCQGCPVPSPVQGACSPAPGPRGLLAPARAAAVAPWAAGGLLCPNWDTRGRGQISQTWSGSNREGEIRSFLKNL